MTFEKKKKEKKKCMVTKLLRYANAVRGLDALQPNIKKLLQNGVMSAILFTETFHE